MVTCEPLPDYTATIRAEIEREVDQVKTQLRSAGASATSVDIGYVANSHRGYPIFRAGETVAGLPLRIEQRDLNTIRVKTACNHGQDVVTRW